MNFALSLHPKNNKNRSNEINAYQEQINQAISTANDKSLAEPSPVDAARRNSLVNSATHLAIDTSLIVSNTKTASSDQKESQTTIQIGFMSILVLFLFVVGMLLLLYFFYNVVSKESINLP